MLKLSYLCSKRNYTTTGRSAHTKDIIFLPVGRYSVWSAFSLRIVTDWSYLEPIQMQIVFRYPLVTEEVHCQEPQVTVMNIIPTNKTTLV